MATFYCSECGFSKPVKDEMAGKKARCPKCNAVNVVPELGEEPTAEPETETGPVEEQAPAEDSAPAETAPADSHEEAAEESVAEESAAEQEPAETTPAPSQSSSKSGSGVPRLSSGWMMAFGAALIPVIAGILLLSFKMVGIAMICFAAGMVAFAGLAAYYSFT